MSNIDGLAQTWKEGGAQVVSRHDFAKSGLNLSALVPTGKLSALSRDLYEKSFSLLDISVLETKETFVVTYHFDSILEPGRVALRVLADKALPQVPSIAHIFQGAEWHERESRDFFGINFIGNPNLIPLLLPEDFSAPPPLRKEPQALASISSLGLFGDAEIIDEGLAPLVNPPKAPAKKEAAAKETTA